MQDIQPGSLLCSPLACLDKPGNFQARILLLTGLEDRITLSAGDSVKVYSLPLPGSPLVGSNTAINSTQLPTASVISSSSPFSSQLTQSLISSQNGLNTSLIMKRSLTYRVKKIEGLLNKITGGIMRKTGTGKNTEAHAGDLCLVSLTLDSNSGSSESLEDCNGAGVWLSPASVSNPSTVLARFLLATANGVPLGLGMVTVLQ